jgi:hypothetical protein
MLVIAHLISNKQVINEVRYDPILVTIYNIDAPILKGFERKV